MGFQYSPPPPRIAACVHPGENLPNAKDTKVSFPYRGGGIIYGNSIELSE